MEISSQYTVRMLPRRSAWNAKCMVTPLLSRITVLTVASCHGNGLNRVQTRRIAGRPLQRSAAHVEIHEDQAAKQGHLVIRKHITPIRPLLRPVFVLAVCTPAGSAAGLVALIYFLSLEQRRQLRIVSFGGRRFDGPKPRRGLRVVVRAARHIWLRGEIAVCRAATARSTRASAPPQGFAGAFSPRARLIAAL